MRGCSACVGVSVNTKLTDRAADFYARQPTGQYDNEAELLLRNAGLLIGLALRQAQSDADAEVFARVLRIALLLDADTSLG